MNYNEVAIVICSYKNRTDILFKYLNNIKDFNIYIAVRDYDYIESGYNKYEFNDNIKFIFLENATNICNTRYEATQRIMSLGYKGMIMIDDDINGKYIYYTTDSEKRKTSASYAPKKKSLEDTCKYIIDMANKYDAGSAGLNFAYNISFVDPGKIRINKHVLFGAFIFLNLTYLKEYNITHDISGKELHEDLDVVLQLLLNGITCITLFDHGFMTKISYESVVGNNDKRQEMQVNTYLKYRDYITFYLSRGKKELRIKPNWKYVFDGYKKYGKQYIIDDEFHNSIYECAKKYDYAGIKNLLENFKK